ncbi:hypothetical protein ACN47E_003292 [Coniothyrium glycines]
MEAVEALPALDDALDSLHEASRIPAKQRTIKVSSVVDVICQHASEYGLDPNAVRDIVQLVSVKTSLDQTSVTTLLKNLYPSQRVPDDVVVTAVGALGQGKGRPSPGTQDSLVKWLTIVHEILENVNVLSRLYGVLFGMLNMISIRTSLCHLLSLITRRRHVKPFRIQQLLELSRGIGNEPALQGLLRVYKDYYPDIILGTTSTSRKSFAPQPDPEWRSRISAIQNATVNSADSMNGAYNGFKVLRKGLRRGKTPAIPEVHTFHATESSVTLEGIDNVNDLVERLDILEPPGQMISLLTDPLLQKYVDLKPSPMVSSRVNLWLATCLEEQYESYHLGIDDPQSLSEILSGLNKHAQYTKVLHPAVGAFLKEYLPIWDGKENIDSILGLLSYIPMESFQTVYSTYFAFAERAIASHNVGAYPTLIDFYTTLLQHLVIAADTQDPQNSKPTLEALTSHVAALSQSLLLSDPHSTTTPLTSPILSFYELLSTSSIPRLLPITLPPMPLIYLLAQSSSTTTLSRICGILGAYKTAFDRHPKPVKDFYPATTTDSFNSCLRDIYNLLWVSRAYSVVAGKSAGLSCHDALRNTLNDHLATLDREYAIVSSAVLAHNFLLAPCAAAAWRVLEEREIERERFDRAGVRYHQGPVSQRSLEALKRTGGVAVEWDGAEGYKVFVLQWLEARGLGGIRELMFATVTNLKGRG